MSAPIRKHQNQCNASALSSAVEQIKEYDDFSGLWILWPITIASNLLYQSFNSVLDRNSRTKATPYDYILAQIWY